MVEGVGINMGNLEELKNKIDKNTEILKKRTELEGEAWEELGKDNPDMKKFNNIMEQIDVELE